MSEGCRNNQTALGCRPSRHACDRVDRDAADRCCRPSKTGSFQSARFHQAESGGIVWHFHELAAIAAINSLLEGFRPWRIGIPPVGHWYQ